MSDGRRLSLPLPLDQVWAVHDWAGSRSFFRDGWTALASGRLCVYHLSAGEGRDEWIEVTTYVHGDWLGESHLDFELEHRAGHRAQRSTYRRCTIVLAGAPRPFLVADRGGVWAGLSEGVDPVLTLLVRGLSPADFVLELVPADQIAGSERFAAR